MLPLISRCDMLGLKNVCFHDKNIQSYRVLSSYMQSFRFNSQYHTYWDYINHNFLNHSIPRRAGEGINSGSPRISISSELQDQVLSTKEVCPRGTKGREKMTKTGVRGWRRRGGNKEEDQEVFVPEWSAKNFLWIERGQTWPIGALWFIKVSPVRMSSLILIVHIN